MSWTERNLAVTLTGFCIPSTPLGIWWRRPGTAAPTQMPRTT
jgi:hypothetical protein